jgi:AhpD family alkylhydroperoxidase
MNTPVGEFYNRWKLELQKIKSLAPETARAFGALHMGLMKEGALPARDKELIALAIGVSKGCTECIYLHTEGAKKAGATKEQVMEAVGVAVMMQGGPAFVHVPAVIDAWEYTAGSTP